MKDITAVICQGQLIIGKVVSDNKEKLCLKSARVFQQIPAADGKGTESILVSYIGHPEMVYLNKALISLTYTPTEQQLINAYIEATSNIKVASTIPFNLKEIPKGSKLN